MLDPCCRCQVLLHLFVRFLVPCVDQLAGRPLKRRLQVMGRTVIQHDFNAVIERLVES